MPFTMVTIVKEWPSRGGLRADGRVVLTPSEQLRNGTDVSAASYTGRVSGRRLSMQVPATNDSGTTPAGRVLYWVDEQIAGVTSRGYWIAVPAGAGTIDLATATKLGGPVDTGAGDVTRADLDAVAASSGGGGGGSYTDEQAQDATAAALAAGTHTGIGFTYNDGAGAISAAVTVTGDLPEHASTARTTADATPTNLVGKLTRYDTTSGAISQTLPAATAGRVFAIGWDGGTNALTLTAAGSDVIGSGATTTVTVPLVGEVLTYHCTTAGRWRVVSGFKTQASLDARHGAILNTHLLAWAYAQAFRLTTATRDANEAITAATIAWPDGSTGTFTTDTASVAFPGAIDAWHATYVPASGATKTVTQTAVTRDTAGAVTAQPALAVT